MDMSIQGLVEDGCTFVLATDIDWRPNMLGAITGITFDGNGYKIKNL